MRRLLNWTLCAVLFLVAFMVVANLAAIPICEKCL